jgi:hypothetical protein
VFAPVAKLTEAGSAGNGAPDTLSLRANTNEPQAGASGMASAVDVLGVGDVAGAVDTGEALVDERVSHRLPATAFRLGLCEALVLILVPILIGVASVFRTPVIVGALLAIGVAFSIGYPKAMGVTYRWRVSIVGILCITFSLILPFTLPDFNLTRGIIIPFSNVIIFTFCFAFLNELFCKNRINLIHSVSHTVCLGLFVSCLCGYLLTWQLLSGLFLGYLLLCISPYVVVGILYLLLTIIDYFAKTQLMAGSARIRVGVLGAVIGLAVARILLPIIDTTFIIRDNDIWYAAATCLLSLCVASAHFSSQKTTSATLIRGLFPIVTVGAFIYIVCVLVQQ